MTTGQMQVPPPVDLDEFVRAALNGSIGEFDSRTLSTQDDACAAMRRYLTGRYHRPLTSKECTQLDIATALEWNRRTSAATCEAHAWVHTYDNGPWRHCDDCRQDHPDNPPHPSSEQQILAEFEESQARVLEEVAFPRAVADTELYPFYRNASRQAMRSWTWRMLKQLPEIPNDVFDVVFTLDQLAVAELARPLFKPEARLLDDVTRDILTAISMERQLEESRQRSEWLDDFHAGRATA